MKIFEIQDGAKIIEPPITGEELPVVYLGDKYIALTIGDKMPNGTEGLKVVDWENDSEIRKDAVSQMTAVARVDSMGESELSVYRALTAPSAKDQQQAFISEVHKEVEKRILSQVSQATLIHLVAAAAGDILTESQMTAYHAGLQWIAQIRATGAELASAGDQDFSDDAKWPAIPSDAAELAAQF